MDIEYDRVQTRAELEDSFWRLDEIIKERESVAGTGPLHQANPRLFLFPLADLYEIDLRILLERRGLSRQARGHGREMLDLWYVHRIQAALIRNAHALQLA